jgi:hypothetical protein
VSRTVRQLAVLAAAAAALAFPGVSSAAEFSASASLSGTTAFVGHPLLASVDFGSLRFVTVDQVCFHFTFAGDLLGAGDDVTISALNAEASMSGPGFSGVGVGEATRSLCIPNQPGFGPMASRFLDGREDRIEIAMGSGAVTISGLTVSVQGIALTPLPAQTVTLTFHSDFGRTVTWSGNVVAGALDATYRADGVLSSLHGTGQLAGGTSVSADFDTRGIGRLIGGSLTATRGNQRIAAKNIIGLASSDGIELASRATFYDGRNTQFGDLSIRVANPADG